MKRYRQGICVVLAAFMTISLCGCGKSKEVIQPMNQEKAYSFSFPIVGGKDVMPIGGYYGPVPGQLSMDGQSMPDYFTDEIYEKFVGCGVNLITQSFTDYANNPDMVIKMLELGEKYDIGLCVRDWNATNAKNPVDMDEFMNAYRDYPAFCGMYVVDEPGNETCYPSKDGENDIPVYEQVFKNLNELDTFGYGNLFPILDKSYYDKYDSYVEEWCETCNPKVLSYDFYPFDKGRKLEDYFYNMDVIRKYANKYEIPFWSFIQAGSQWNDAAKKFDTEGYYPSEGEMTWNVNTCLAFGSKGIQYFPLLQPHYFAFAESTPFDFYRNGLVGMWGNKTQWWYYAKTINEQITAVDEVLMNAVNKGVIVSGEEAKEHTKGLEAIIEGTSWRELEDVTGNVLIGCFNYQGKSALYVVNYEREYAQKVTLNLQDTYKLSMTQNAEETKIETDKLELDLKAGEAVLVVFE